MPARLLLIASSPRIPAGQLSWSAWEALRAGPVHTRDAATDQARAVAAAGVSITELSAVDDRSLAGEFFDRGRAAGVAVWLAGPDGDTAFVRALGDLAARGGAQTEVIYGSYDPPGARLLDVVAVMDRLRADCPWDREQTHASLAKYLLEEAYEAADAITAGDLGHLREELGDVLLQVAFHARIAEDEEPGWSVDDVAGDLVDKLVRRHPHVFAGLAVDSAAQVNDNWERIKRAEKGRMSVLDGVPLALPALTLAQTIRRKALRAGVPAELLGVGAVDVDGGDGQDLEAGVRAAALDLRTRVLAAEDAAREAGLDPSALDAGTWRRLWPGPTDRPAR